MDEFTSEHVHAELSFSVVDQRRLVQYVHRQSRWVYCFGRCGRSGGRNSHGRAGKAQWKGLFMNISIIGTGQIGEVIVRKLRSAGHPVKMANSRDPESLENLAADTGAVAVSIE